MTLWLILVIAGVFDLNFQHDIAMFTPAPDLTLNIQHLEPAVNDHPECLSKVAVGRGWPLIGN